MAGTLKDAAKEMLTHDGQQETPAETPMKLSHPTLDSPMAAHRVTYNPPPPEKRFTFLKDYARVPGLRAKGRAAAQQAGG